MTISPQSEQSPPVHARRKIGPPLLAVFALLLPLLAIGAAWLLVYRPMAEARRSTNNLKHILIGMHNHHDTFRSLPNGYIIGRQKEVRPIKPSTHRFSWRVQLLPYIEQVALFDQFRFDEPWDSEHNLKVAANMPEVFRSRWDPPGTTDAGYLHVEDPNAAFPTAGPIPTSDDPARYSRNSFGNITDGPGSTIGVIEVANSGIHWAQPTDITMAEAVALLQKGKVPSPGTSEVRSPSALVGMMDASLLNVPIGISAADAKALFTRHGGEQIDYAALGWEKPEPRSGPNRQLH